MIRYILKRIVIVFFTTFIILSLTFILMKMLPAESAIGQADQRIAFYEDQVRLGYMIAVNDPAIADVSIVTPNMHYHFQTVPVLVQYWRWIVNIVTKWNWGHSTRIAINEPVTKIMAQKLPTSIRLNIIALFTSVPFGFLFGVIAALRKNKPTDHFISTSVMIFISIPSFVFITFLMLLFSYRLGWLPTQWPKSGATDAIKFKGYIIPVAALSFGTIAGFTRYTRAELTEIMASEFLLLARTKGLTKRQTVVRHALRNSMVPIMPMIIGQFIGILSGSMILENLYGIPGIGSLFIEAIGTKDYNVVMVDMAIYTVIGLLATLLVDLSYGLVDPRIRMGARK